MNAHLLNSFTSDEQQCKVAFKSFSMVLSHQTGEMARFLSCWIIIHTLVKMKSELINGQEGRRTCSLCHVHTQTNHQITSQDRTRVRETFNMIESWYHMTKWLQLNKHRNHNRPERTFYCNNESHFTGIKNGTASQWRRKLFYFCCCHISVSNELKYQIVIYR